MSLIARLHEAIAHERYQAGLAAEGTHYKLGSYTAAKEDTDSVVAEVVKALAKQEAAAKAISDLIDEYRRVEKVPYRPNRPSPYDAGRPR